MGKSGFTAESSFVSAKKHALLLMAVVLLSSTVGLRAQENGTIVGTVTDQSGAVVPGVTITATNQSTGSVARTTASNSDGNYALPGLAVSTYSVRAEKTG